MASNPEQPKFAEVFVKSEPPEEEQSATAPGFKGESVVKEELIIDQDEAEKAEQDDEDYKAVRIKYLPDGTIKCHECEKIMPGYKAYIQHIRRHRNIRLRRFRCKPCNKLFSGKGDLVRHDRNFHGEPKTTEGNQVEAKTKHATEDEEVKPEAKVLEENGLFRCSECGKTFQKRGVACFSCKTALVPHERAHQVMKAAAPPPSARAKSPVEVMRHDAVAFKCAECGLVFDKRKSYFKHARRHEIIKRGVFQCHICNMYLAAPSELNRHLERQHQSESKTKPSRTPLIKADKTAESTGLVCGTCGKLLPNYQSFRRHVQRHDDLEKGTFRCNQCGQYFSTKHGLISHLKRSGHSQQTSTTVADAEEVSESSGEGCSSEEINLSDTRQVSKPAKPKLVLKKIVIKKVDE